MELKAALSNIPGAGGVAEQPNLPPDPASAEVQWHWKVEAAKKCNTTCRNRREKWNQTKRGSETMVGKEREPTR